MSDTALLEIKDLYARVDNKDILKGLNLTIREGEVHALMGPNGAGKSTLSHVIAGKPGYEVVSGSILYKGKNLLDMSPEQRACEGVFLSMQYPIEIPGVPVSTFLMHALNSVLKYKNLPILDTLSFIKELRIEAAKLGISNDMLKRFINTGFSGGEKKRLETLQMAVLKPSFSILDEVDSGLDIDALKVVSEGINSLKTDENAILLITHYQRILNYIIPDFVHIYTDGKIVKSGGKELALELEEKGYADFIS